MCGEMAPVARPGLSSAEKHPRSASARTTEAAERGTGQFKNPEAPAVKREAEEDWGR
jgi:hypothetical protein